MPGRDPPAPVEDYAEPDGLSKDGGGMEVSGMAKLFGREYTRGELLARVGDVSQLCAAEPARLAGGKSEGVLSVRFRTGSGLNFTVLPGRGLDIAAADFRGQSLCWLSPTGVTAPEFYEPEGLSWLRSFGGGLLTTCGLTYAGAPCRDGDRELGLHGRIANLPAEGVWIDGAWEGDDYRVWVQGKVREAAVFGENLMLTRRITAHLGESRILIEDAVENLGHEPAEHMLIYHFNLGFPLVDTQTEFVAQSRGVAPRDREAAAGIGAYARCAPPTPGFREQVYYHEPVAGPDGRVKVALVNPAAGGGEGLGIYLAYARENLPILIQWKMMGQGTYVMGIEPANCRTGGREAERSRGTLVTLAPGEIREYRLELGVLATGEEISRTVDEIRALA